MLKNIFKNEVILKENERIEDLQNGYFVIQDKDGYNFNSDSVKLAKFASFKTNSVIIDLCSGSGTLGFLLASDERFKNIKRLINVEIQEKAYDRSLRSTKLNGLEGIILNYNLDVKDCYIILGQGIADVIICNPPYSINSPNKNKNDEIAISRHEIKITLNEIFASANKLLKFGGKFFLVHKSERLVDICVFGRANNLEVKIIKFIAGNCILVECMKGAKMGLLIDKD